MKIGTPCVVGVTDCGAGKECLSKTQGSTEGSCEPASVLSCTADEACGEACCDSATEFCGENGACQPLLPPQPRLTRVQFSDDCTHIELLGEASIQPPAAYASSTGSIGTLCHPSVSGEASGFRCTLSTGPVNSFLPGTHTALWTVRDDKGGVSTADYSFQTTLEAIESTTFPMERLSPSAVLGRDAMVGRQALASQPLPGGPSAHSSGEGCWGGMTLRGSIAVGDYCNCALQANGTVQCWGGCWPVPPGLSAVAIAVAGGHSCALRSDGTVRCWGWNEDGQTDVPPELNNAVAIAAGGAHSCALRNDGTVECWGIDNGGEYDYRQIVVPLDLNDAVAIAAGYAHTCALRSNGTVECWGWNEDSQADVPPGLNNVVAIAAGGIHSCALEVGGTVECWGWNEDNQTDVPPGLNNVVAIAAGAYHSCALEAGGTVECWGWNEDSQADVPPGLSNVVAIAAGWFHTCALQDNGNVSCWGINDKGEDDYGQATNHSGAAVQRVGQLVIK